MRLYNTKTKQVEDVADEQAQEAFLSGSHNFLNDQPVPMELPDGSLARVRAQDVQGYLEQGGRVSSEADVREQELNEKYGGVGGTLAAGGEGLVRSWTLGISDPIAIEAARLFGGKEAADTVRTHLAEEKEAHPYVSTAGELLGLVSPFGVEEAGAKIAAGAAEKAALKEGAELAANPSMVRQILSWSPQGMSSQLGRQAEAWAAQGLGETAAKSALGRVALATAKTGAEMAPYGAGQEISEEALGDQELNAEKIMAAATHSALAGALLGGLGAGVVQGAKPLHKLLSPKLEDMAGEYAARALDPKMKVAREVFKRGGGPSEWGQTLIRRGIFETDGKGIVMGAQTAEELAPRVRAAAKHVGEELEAARATYGGPLSGIKLSQVSNDLEEQIIPHDKSLVSGLTNNLRETKATILDRLTDGRFGVLKATILDMERNGLQATDEYMSAIRKLADLMQEEIPFSKLFEQRGALDELSRWQTIDHAPELLEGRRNMRYAMEQLELQAIENGGKNINNPVAREEYKALKRDYQHLRMAKDAVDRAEAASLANRKLSLTDYMTGGHFGIPAAMSGLVAGHVGAPFLAGVAAHWAARRVHRFIRTKGNAMAAMALSKLAKFDVVAKSAMDVDRALARIAAWFVGKDSKEQVPHKFAFDAGEAPDRRHAALVDHVSNLPDHILDRHVEQVAPGMNQHLPKTTQALVQKVNTASAYLKAIAPPPLAKPSLSDPLPAPRVTDTDAEEFYRIAHAVDDPIGTFSQAIETGRLGREEVQAMQAVYPKLFAELRERVVNAMATPGKEDLPYEKVTLLSTLFGVNGDPTLEPQAIMGYQSAFNPGVPRARVPQAGKPPRGIEDDYKLELDRAASRR